MQLSDKAMDHLCDTTKWASADGPVLIKDMELGHLHNARRVCRECYMGNAFYEYFTCQEWVELFTHELDRRHQVDNAKVEALLQRKRDLDEMLNRVRSDMQILQELEEQQQSDLDLVQNQLDELTGVVRKVCMA